MVQDNITDSELQRASIAIAKLCKHGFMNGWFGDTSEDFQRDQLLSYQDLTAKQRSEWWERNKFNLEHYCQ